MSRTPRDDEAITMDEAAGILRVQKSTIRGLIFNRRLKRMGSRRTPRGHILGLVSKNDVLELAAARAAKKENG